MDKTTKLLNEVIDEIRQNSFVEGYKDKATTEECLGLAVARFLKWDSRIFRTFYEALEDANFHRESAEIEERYRKYF